MTETQTEPDDEQFTSIMACAQATETSDFDHRLLFANVSMALFGRGKFLTIGKYRVDRRIGEGGMGEVYLCTDEDLGRAVAIKRVLDSGSKNGQERLRREARALARLNHRNVVQVYDSGEHEGRTYLAMEYVEGQTLREWLSVARPWREILAAFISAGRGLAAAHAAGLVHRDFKADNVLVGDDGIIRVADFGLALGDEVHVKPAGEGQPLTPRTGPARLSAVGSLAGTRQYMPLEQIEGRDVDARSDQFAFCMSLYEALWGEFPFAYRGLDVRIAALRADSPTRPRGHPDLFRVIRRGLARDPEARWPSMDALLAALERVPRRRRRVAVAGVVSIAFGLGLGLLALVPSPPAPVSSAQHCVDVEQELVGVWDQRARTQLEGAVESLSAGHVPESEARVLAGLDQWHDAWLSERRAACTRLSTQKLDPERLRAARDWDMCLTRQRREVSTIVEQLVDGDADTLAKAVVSIADLPPPSRCADDLSKLGVEPPAPAIAGKVDAVRAQLDRTRQLRALGEWTQAHTIASELEAKSLELDYRPLIVEAKRELAAIEELGGSTFRSAKLYEEAIEIASSEHLDELAAQLLVERAELSLFELAQPSEARVHLEWAAAEARRAGLDPQRRPSLALARGRLAELEGDDAQARLHYEDALQLAGDDAPERASYLASLAGVVARSDRAAAADLRRRAYELASERWGPLHPLTARYELDYGVALDNAGDDGTDHRAHALQILAESSAPVERAISVFEAASDAIARGDYSEARAHALALAELQDRFLAKTHPDRGEPEYLLAIVESTSGRPALARDHARRALELFASGPEAARTTAVRELLAEQLITLGELDEAEAQLIGLVDAVDDGAEQAAIAHLQLADIAVRRGRLDDADEQLRACARAHASLGPNPLTYELLRALVDLRRGTLDAEQRHALDTARGHDPLLHERVSAWLDQLDVSDEERRALGL